MPYWQPSRFVYDVRGTHMKSGRTRGLKLRPGGLLVDRVSDGFKAGVSQS